METYHTYEFAAYRETKACVLSTFFFVPVEIMHRIIQLAFRYHRVLNYPPHPLCFRWLRFLVVALGSLLFIELVTKLGLRPPLFFLTRHSRSTLRYDLLRYHLSQNSRRERGCCPDRQSLRFTICRLGGSL